MKKRNYLILGLAGLAMASCSNEDIPGPAEGIYQLTVSLPKDMGTRAIGDTPTGQTLYYTLFQVNGSETTVVEDQNGVNGVALNTDNKATLDLPLVKGYTYKIAFFACTDAAKSVYSYSGGQLDVTYENMTYGEGVAADAYDCFAGMADLGQVNGSLSQNVELTRPVAQINWGSSDLNSATVTSVFGSNLQTELTVTVPSTLNILTSTYGEATTPVTLPAAPTPAANEEFPVEDYSYLAMQYVLAQKSMTSNLTLKVSKSGDTSVTPVTVTVDNAPLQANYRTNIYGALLTNQATLNVSLAPWGTPSNNISLVWDGQTKTEPEISGNNVLVQKPSDLAGLADMVNGEGTSGKPEDFAGMTILISADFDMAGAEFPMMGSTTRSGSNANGNSFKGVFDGQDHTISNLVVKGSQNADEAVGFISNLAGESAEFKNVTFDNLTIDAPNSKQAGLIGILTEGAKVTDVTVTSGSVKAAQGGGGIVGRMTISGTIESCSNGASVTCTVQNGGGIVGAAYYSGTDAVNMTIIDCHNTGDINCPTSTGGIAGLCAANVDGCTNSGKITGTTSSVGGIVGWQNSAGSVKGCTNNGDVMLTGNPSGNTYGTGGIVGWVRYAGSTTDYPFQQPIVVSGNTNNGSVSGYTGVGGIVGIWYMCGTCSGNYNYAPALACTGQWVSGIVGAQQWTENMPAGDYSGEKLTVSNNTSTTTLAQMTGSPKALIIYINSGANVITEGNDPEQTR